MQRSFSDLEYAAKKKVTRRDRFLGEIDAVTPWPALLAEVQPFYPKGEGRGRPPIGLERMLRMYTDSDSGRLRKQAEQIKASIRAKVEHPFHFVKNVFALRKTRYRRLAKNAAQLFTLFGLANLLIAKRRLSALEAPGAS